MFIDRLFKRQFPLKNRVRGVVFLFFMLLMTGCGEETIDNRLGGSADRSRATEDFADVSPIYYPVTVGSRWVYRNPDGSEWSREVIQTEYFSHNSYHSFSYNPPIESEGPDFIKSPTYVVAPDGIFLKTKKNDINNSVWQTVEKSRGDFSGWSRGHKFSKGVWTTQRQHDDILVYLFYSKIRVIGHSNFALLHLPPDYTRRRKVLDMILIGNENLNSMDYIHDFEVKIRIWGTTSFEPVVTTPIGKFENCLKLRYEAEPTPVVTLSYKKGEGHVPRPEQADRAFLKHVQDEIRKELTMLLPMLMQNLNLQTVWLAPGVGPVKIETPNGIAELIDYEIK